MSQRLDAGPMRRPNVTLRLLDEDHQLAASIDTIWAESATFLGLQPDPGR